MLRGMGEAELAERLEYLASEADLDPGESAATDASARGFFEFFCNVECDSKVGLACSPEGWIVGEWRWFPDERRVGIWFLDAERGMFASTKRNGEFVAIEGQRNFTDISTIMILLVQEGLFARRV